MNRFYKIMIFAVLTMLMMVSISYSGSIAQGVETPDDVMLPPEGSEKNPPPGEALGSDSSQSGEDSEPAVLAPDNTAALVSSSFTYQGQLKNGGAAVNAQCDFIWNLFATSSSATSLGTDTDTGVQLTNGLFTVVINVPANVMDGNARYVEIQVRCPTGTGVYTTLTPRQELQAAPYALGLRLPFSHSIIDSTSPIFAITNTGGNASSPSVLGSSMGGDGVHGLSTGGASADNGVYSETNSTSVSEAGVKGISTDAATGGYFTSSAGDGVYGSAASATNFGGYFTNSTTTTSGGALYASGDAKQTLASDGFVKAGAYVDCGNSASLILRSFNNVNTTTITVINGASVGRCTVDFGFDVNNRYVTAMAFGNGVPRIVTYVNGSTGNRLDFFRLDQDGTGVNGGIMILIY